jgi:glycosyltransferase involved in cell wall biosynthesis
MHAVGFFGLYWVFSVALGFDVDTGDTLYLQGHTGGEMANSPKVSRTLVVIPAFRVSGQILDVVRESLVFVDHVLVVDDACPEQSGLLVLSEFEENPRVNVIFNLENLGVGGAMKAGYLWGLEQDFVVFVKVDGDGQMDPALIPDLIYPIQQDSADFSKGNRFNSPRLVHQMPKLRLVGNGFLSLFSKISSGYWSVNDPTNGFIAISRSALERLEVERLSNSYFFESDLLFRLSIIKGRITEFPMTAKYGEEKSNLKISRVVFTFPFLHLKNFLKRIVYNYYVREWSIGSIELPLGIGLAVWGVYFGLGSFGAAQSQGLGVTAGQAVATAIGIILGFQLLLSFVSHDIQAEPRKGHQN